MSVTDVAKYLNDQLAKKAQVKVQKSRNVKTQVCRLVSPSVRSGGEDYLSCHDETITETYEDFEFASVSSTEVKDVRDLLFSKDTVVSLPEITLLSRKDIVNLGDASITSSQTLSVSGTRGWSFTKTRSITTTIGATRNLSVGIPGIGSSSMGLSWSQGVTVSNSTTESWSETVTRSTSETVSVGPRRCVAYELLAYQVAVEIVITASLVVDGALNSNTSGLTLASELLSIEERTLPFEAILRIEDVSHAIIRTRDIGATGSNGGDSPIRITEMQQKFVGSGGDYLKGFSQPSKLARNNGVAVQNLLWNDGPGIGVPDGIRYEVLYTTNIYKPAFECGFNDAGLLNAGMFNVEVRQYSEHSQGALLRQWNESVETFTSCIPV